MTQPTRNYIWDIERLAWRDLGILPNVVTDIHWKLSCVDTVTGATAIVIGATDLNTVDLDPNQFVDLAQVTEDVARTWLMAAMDPEFTQAQLDEVDRRLDQAMAIKSGLPWSNNSVVNN